MCARFGDDGQWWAIIVAAIVAGVVGAVIAIPALRLSGVYLALGTAAIAVIFDRWIFTLPSFEIAGLRISLFDQGSIEVPGPSLFGFAVDTPERVTVFGAVVLALMTVGVALLRRGRLGRRLIALRDSEAAFATLGGNLLAGKLLVFGLSSAIAGVGGGLYGMSYSRPPRPVQLHLGTADLPGRRPGRARLGGCGPVRRRRPVRPVACDRCAVAGDQGDVAGTARDRCCGLRRQGRPGVVVSPSCANAGTAFDDDVVMGGLVVWTLIAWVLRLTDVVNGYVLVLLLVLAAVLVPVVASWRLRRSNPAAVQQNRPMFKRANLIRYAGRMVGNRQDWAPEDEEALDRAIAARS